ncbi:MAG: PAS domain S-box protein [Planctomycetales bacterium]|nr:PAS domain S-box protein [Planctomycetales bacterium]NIM08162.1 PAS domain S-box protein [Planctomycetales bacterium]NIN07659.1 PAS domain S-box protein [Planctomycetales bacterium]NIN76776.1 PAS domain S-box protein [Planctomycetales bacterium]NIO33985.1 PAS domain S-box protein [Planctomycetales bacterium]
MLIRKSHTLLILASIMPTVGLLCGWMVYRWFPSHHWLARLDLLLVALAVVGIYGAYQLGGLVRGQTISCRYLDLLLQMEVSDLKECDIDQRFAELPPGSSWVELITRCRNHLLLLNQRLNDAEMKQAASEVRSRRNARHERQMSHILESLTDPIMVIDDYDELILANPTAAELFGFQLDPEEKQLLADLVECESIVRLMHETRRRRSSRERSCEVELQNPQGEAHWYRVTARNLQPHDAEGAQGCGEGTVAILQDISTHKEIQKRNAEFVSSVSHEMKTPLSSIKAYLELIEDGDVEDEQTLQEFLQIIRLQADRLQRLVENLLNIARIEAGVVKVSKANQSLNEILEEALEIMQPAAAEKEIQLKKDLSQMYLGVHVDRDLILQAAINLLSNAVKYTPREKAVTLRSRLVSNRVEFEVEDAGVGLSEEDQQRVFEKFYRVGKDQQMASGTGLGLPLAKHIVEDVHQGQIQVESKLHEGSKFTIQLPGAGMLS